MSTGEEIVATVAKGVLRGVGKGIGKTIFKVLATAIAGEEAADILEQDDSTDVDVDTDD